MKWLNQLVFAAMGCVVLASATVGAAPTSKGRDVCVAAPTGGGGFNTFVFRDVAALSPGRAVALLGLYFTTGSQRVAPVHGSAIMASDGSVRLGFFVHTTAESTNDFTVAGVTDANFAGTVSFDNDGDFKVNGTLDLAPVDCDTLTIP